MRVLTRYEHIAFEIAFNFIDRVCLVGLKAETIFDIKVSDNGNLNALPKKVVSFIVELGGTIEASKFFNGHAKEKTLPRFIKKLMDNHEQPREYFAEGTLTLDIVPVTVVNYKE